MIISDLNYLENTSAEVIGGVGININSRFALNKDVNARVNVNENFTKRFDVNTRGIVGNTAEVLGSSDAVGNNTFTSIIFGTQTEPGKSESFVNATSATNG